MTTVQGKKHGGAIWWVLAAAMIVRMLVAIVAVIRGGGKAFSMPDSPAYVALAEGLAATGAFETAGHAELYRVPGYPVMLMPGLGLGQVELVTVGLQVLLSCLTVYLVFRIGLLLTDKPTTAMVGAALYAIEPLSVLYCSRLLSETLFTSLVAAFLFALLRYLRGKDGPWKWLLASALLVAGTGYVRPIGYCLAVVVTVVLAAWALRQDEKWKRLGQVVAFAAVTLAATGAWQVRNYVRAGYVGFSAVADEWMYFYAAAAVRAQVEGVSYYQMQKQMGYGDEERYLAEHPEQRDWTMTQQYRFMRREGWRIIGEQPAGVAVGIYFKGMARALFDPGAIEYFRLFGVYPTEGGLLGRVMDEGLFAALQGLRRERPGAFWMSVVLGLLLLDYISFAVIGMAQCWSALNIATVVLVTVAVYFLLLAGGPQSEGRFRHPIMPILCVFAGVGLVKMLSLVKQKESV